MVSIDRLGLGTNDVRRARDTFIVVAEVFEEPHEELSDDYIVRLLNDPAFWVLTAHEDGEILGGLTAHTIPLTRLEERELFLFDIAVRPEHHRRGIGRQLIDALLELGSAEGIGTMFVAVDNEDIEALDFYRGTGGSPAPVTIFDYQRPSST